MSATYVFGSRRAYSASLVADSNRMGSTPVASGSSVPAWPTRRAPVSRRSRRTTANDVSPAALSTLRTPVLNGGRLRRSRLAGPASPSALRRAGKDRLLGGRQNHLQGLLHRHLELGSRRPDVSAAAKEGAHRRRIDGAAAPHADL